MYKTQGVPDPRQGVTATHTPKEPTQVKDILNVIQANQRSMLPGCGAPSTELLKYKTVMWWKRGVFVHGWPNNEISYLHFTSAATMHKIRCSSSSCNCRTQLHGTNHRSLHASNLIVDVLTPRLCCSTAIPIPNVTQQGQKAANMELSG